jgi:hypothetical protein
MNDDADAAKRYRQRAKEVRAILQTTEDQEMRKALEGIASDYERLARSRIRIGRLGLKPKWPTFKWKKRK